MLQIHVAVDIGGSSEQSLHMLTGQTSEIIMMPKPTVRCKEGFLDKLC